MKKEILGAVVMMAALSASVAQAQVSVCAGANAPTTAAFSVQATDGFVVTEFDVRCSSNVILQGDDLQTFFTVAAASVKGRNAFNGTSNGGAIGVFTLCASSTICTPGDVSSALSAASTM